MKNFLRLALSFTMLAALPFMASATAKKSGPGAKSATKEFSSNKPQSYPMGVSNSQGCGVTAQFSPSFICSGNCMAITFSGINGGTTATFTWGPTTNGSLANPNTIQTDVGGAGTTSAACVTFTNTTTTPSMVIYTVTVSFNATSSCTSTAAMMVNPIPAINTLPTPTVCDGKTVTLGANPPGGPTSPTTGASYTWTTVPSGPTTSNPSFTMTSSSPTTYTVSVTGPGGCGTSSTQTVVRKVVTASASVSKSPVCANEQIDVIGTPGSTPTFVANPPTYSWSSVGGPTPPPTVSFTSTPSVNTTYTFTVTDSDLCSATAQTTVVVDPTPTVAYATTTFCFNQSKTITHTGSAITSATWSTSVPAGGPTVSGVDPAISGSPCGTYDYTVTVSSAAGCTSTSSLKIVILCQITGSQNYDVKSTTCNPDGCVGITIAGGLPSYTVTWSAPGTQTPVAAGNPLPGSTATYCGLPFGSYTANVTDANGCSAQITATVVAVGAPTFALVKSDETCFGADDGCATFTVNAPSPTTVTSVDLTPCPPGVTISSCSVTNPSLPANIVWCSLPPDTYTVKVTDSNGCTSTVDFTIGSVPEIIINVTPIPNCLGTCKGTASFTSSGGPGGTHVPSISPSAGVTITGGTITGLCQNTMYVLTIQDGICQNTASFTIAQPDDIVPAVLTSTDASCTTCDGSVQTVTLPTGGSGGSFTGPITPVWAGTGTICGGGTTPTITAGKGDFSVTFTDNGTPLNCKTVSTYTVVELGAPVITLCTNGCKYPSEDTATDGVLCWNVIKSNQSVAGPYNITVTRQSDGVVVYTGTVPGTGTHAVTVDGHPGTGTIGAIGKMKTDRYCLTATAAACSATLCDSICKLPPFKATFPGESPSCDLLTNATYTDMTGDNNGIVRYNIVSGTGPFNVTIRRNTGSGLVPFSATSWATAPQTNKDITINAANAQDFPGTNICVTYVIDVDDATSAPIQSGTYILCRPVPYNTATANPLIKKNATCFGLCDGALTVDTTSNPLAANRIGGSKPYTYKWSSGPVTRGITSLCAPPVGPANYTVTITDALKCSTTRTDAITQPVAVTTTLTSSAPPLCYGDATGSFTVTSAQGQPTYNYQYATGPGSPLPTLNTDGKFTTIAAGTHTVTVTDNRGCTSSVSVTIVDPPLLKGGIVTATIAPSCSGKRDGSITVGVHATNAGTPGPGSMPGINPYKIEINYPNATPSFSQQTTSATFGGLPDSTYTIIITDGNGCTSDTTQNIQAPNALTATATATNVSCYPLNGVSNDGQVTLRGNGGTKDSLGNYQSWVVNPLTSNPTPTYNPPPPPPPNTATPTTVYGFIPMGTYTYTLTDVNNCSATGTFAIGGPPLLKILSTTPTNARCHNVNDGTITVLVTGGTTPYQKYKWRNDSTSTPIDSVSNPSPNNPHTIPNLGGARMGNPLPYTITVTDSRGCTTDTTEIVTRPDTLKVLFTTVKNASCYQSPNPDGCVRVEVKGGTRTHNALGTPGPFGGPINNPQDTARYCGLAGDTSLAGGRLYTITITDNKGCAATASTRISEPKPVRVTVSAPSTICLGMSDTLFATSVKGGTPSSGPFPYNYNWSGNPITGPRVVDRIVVTPPNTTGAPLPYNYSLMVTDSKGCTGSAATTVTVRDSIHFLSLQYGPNYCQESGDSAVLKLNPVVGGTGNYTYQWSSTDPNPCIIPPFNLDSVHVNPQTAGAYTYKVVVSDGCSPQQTKSGIITIFEAPDFYYSAKPDKGCSVLDVNFEIIRKPVNMVNPPTMTVSFTKVNGEDDIASTTNFDDIPVSFSYYDKAPAGRNKGISTFPVYFLVRGQGGSGSAAPVCSTETTIVIKVFQKPVISCISSAELVTNIKPSATFIAYANDPQEAPYHIDDYPDGHYKYYWDQGDGTPVAVTFKSQSNNTYLASYNQASTGSYKGSVVVETTEGCLDTAECKQSVQEESVIWIPDVFTPNGDDINDKFGAEIFNMNSYIMYIYDRWGNPIFVSNRYEDKWDGKDSKGQPAQMDTYVYKIVVTDYRDRQLKPFIGKISLIR